MLTKAHIFALLKEPTAETYGALLRCVVEQDGFRIRWMSHATAGAAPGPTDFTRTSRHARRVQAGYGHALAAGLSPA